MEITLVQSEKKYNIKR